VSGIKSRCENTGSWWRVQPRGSRLNSGMASQVVEKFNLQRLFVVGQFATRVVLVGSHSWLSACQHDIAPNSQECLSYSAN